MDHNGGGQYLIPPRKSLVWLIKTMVSFKVPCNYESNSLYHHVELANTFKERHNLRWDVVLYDAAYEPAKIIPGTARWSSEPWHMIFSHNIYNPNVNPTLSSLRKPFANAAFQVKPL